MADKPWEQMSPEERRAWRIERWRNPGVEFTSAQAEADHKARIDRIVAAIELREPDRVPVSLMTGFWPAASAGITQYEAMSDPKKARKAWVDFNLKFEPDTMTDPVHNTVPGSMFEALDYRLYSWPGHGVAKDVGYQYNENEWMLQDEYDALISDPTDYLLRTYLPRTTGGFAGFSGLSTLLDFVELPFVSGHVGGWDSPEMLEGFERMIKAARARNEWWNGMALPCLVELMSLGFPMFRSCGTKAPFDILGDTLRGTKGVLIDMFRCPDKVLAACDRLLPLAIDWAFKRREAPATPIVFIPLHKGADGFMSEEQFRRFYWPTLQKLLLGLIEQGMIPFLFAEGRYASRLELITDLPKGSTIWLFDQTDLAKAKRTIGQVACIEGNMPLSLLYAGTKEEVVQHTRRMIDEAGQGGGYIVDMGAVGERGKDENLRAMIETTWEYGTY